MNQLLSLFFDKLKTFIKPNNSIIIAGDKYNDTPEINQSFDDTVEDITRRENQYLKASQQILPCMIEHYVQINLVIFQIIEFSPHLKKYTKQ